MATRQLAHHVLHLMAIERHKGYRAVMRAHTPGCTELWPSGDEKEQGRQRAALRNPAQYIDGGRIGLMRIFDRKHDRLTPRSGHYEGRERGQLPTTHQHGDLFLAAD
jgi:hypothetical protein